MSINNFFLYLFIESTGKKHVSVYTGSMLHDKFHCHTILGCDELISNMLLNMGVAIIV